MIESEVDEVTSFPQLQEMRRDYVKSARRNGFEAGLRTLLSELYPDNAHFIYELLQNAEDAQAHTVNFTLHPDRLVVTHDGARLFSLANIEQITGLGQSQKRDDETQIGKFGVGFKAVFAYTTRPEIRSGDYAFAIEDLFVPQALETPGTAPDTTFVFPFDREDKPSETAYEEVARGLHELGNTTVLFLTNIHRITYSIVGRSAGSLTRRDDGYPRITIVHEDGATHTETAWLRLDKSTEIDGKRLSVAAAFHLAEQESSPSKSSSSSKKPKPQETKARRLRVRPIHGETCIYFPAASEASGLRFHINAPFASTVARDSVRSAPENAQLVNAIGELIAESLPLLKKEGLVDDGLLATLPNDSDAIDSLYDPIRSAVISAFQTQDLTPVHGGRVLARADSLVSSPAEFRQALDMSDLPFLLERAGIEVSGAPRWIASRDGDAGRFLESLGVDLFDWTELRSAIGGLNSREGWRDWLDSKSDERLRALYQLIGGGILDGRFYGFLIRPVPLIRRHSPRIGNQYRPGSMVFLPKNPEDDVPGFRVSDGLLYFENDPPSKSKSALEAFYHATGARHWDDAALVDQRLNAYATKDFPPEEQNIEDVQLFVRYADEHPKSLKQFENVWFLAYAKNDGSMAWAKPFVLYLDTPYASTDLGTLYGNENKHAVSDRYQGIGGFEEFAASIGVLTGLTIADADVAQNPEFDYRWYYDGNRSHHAVFTDWDLPDFDRILELEVDTLLRHLWDFACTTPASRAVAIYQRNARATRHKMKSQLVHRMEGREWVLDRDGYLRTPESMTVEELPIGWPEPEEGSLASHLGFGREVRERTSARALKRAHASALGVSLDIVEAIAGLGDEQRQREALEAIAEIAHRPSLAEATSSDPERRAAAAIEDAQGAPSHRTEIRPRSVTLDPSGVAARRRSYLRHMYSADDALLCQACHKPMPFRTAEGWYFDAVTFVTGRQKTHHHNALALDPVCAAMYKNVLETSPDSLLEALNGLVVEPGAGRVELAVRMNGTRYLLHFTTQHAIDLKAALEVAGQAR